MKNERLYIGILSGTSMDSIDCGIYCFQKNKFREIAFYESAYPRDIKNEIKKDFNNLKENHTKSKLHIRLSNEYSKIVNKILIKEKIKFEEIEAIGMHGQTISHLKHGDKNVSIQLGSAKNLAKETKIKVISDFRIHDIENGGEGAPLAPLFHDYVFRDSRKKRVVVNIGGISNVSLLTNYKNDKIFGFDSGPGNTLIDSWTKNNFNFDYDENGIIASKHQINDNLLNIFLKDSYFKKEVPKSTTTEYFCYDWIMNKIKLNKISYDKGEVLSTLTMLTAKTIVDSIKDNYYDCDEIFLSGGGAFNKTLFSNIMENVSIVFPNKITVNNTESLGFNPKSVEAGLFAWLAMNKINDIELDYTNVTGAKKPCTLGNIYNFM